MDKDLAFSRAVFAERALENAVKLGAKQYVIFHPYANRFAYRKPAWAKQVRVFEIDRLDEIYKKLNKLEQEGVQIPKDVYYIEGDFGDNGWRQTLLSCNSFEETQQTVFNGFGVSQRLNHAAFEMFLKTVHDVMGEGSAIVFDYIDQSMGLNSRSYSEFDMELLLSRCGFRLYEHVNAEEMRQQYLRFYNLFSHKPPIVPPTGLNYCLAVKKYS